MKTIRVIVTDAEHSLLQSAVKITGENLAQFMCRTSTIEADGIIELHAEDEEPE